MSASTPGSGFSEHPAPGPGEGPGSSSRRVLILVLVGIAVIVGSAISIVRSQRSTVKEGELAGTITFVDVANRVASMEVLNEDGSAFDLTGKIPQGCPITIDGVEAAVGDLEVGDDVRVKGRVERVPDAAKGEKGRRIVADWVHVTRQASAGE